MSTARRRFWTDVSVESAGTGFDVRLDGRPIRLPQGASLSVPTQALADAIAEEWRAIAPSSAFTPDDLPLTRIAGTMIERIAPAPDATRAALLQIGLNDLLCYRTDGAMGALQAARFDPWLGWFAPRGGRLATTNGILPVVQTDETRQAMTHLLTEQGVPRLAALGVAAQASGSLVLAMALVERVLTPEEALALASLDETEQLRIWGDDPHLADTIAGRGTDLAAAACFAALS
ncbi:ATP12 family protein [Tanticharoenia sakaeratensis]|uniref:ATP synthase F1 mitochondrial assembly chaperone ATP12 n=1 Tax=Tanticharoenia sakaeratensis NBRC 103193 TaxID=1231623 RepID=A0A0D6MHF2_9PROT|nr:ATP12 family protein [Tanticharoenia sakaeratensis]GAN53057.1 ATP synthase F1 mitochondrial assembly chaperone ATP12 [Tanticharoenia sakaeratensis NBRC 103193]GBQ19646.1 ATP synthase F1 mitochondrial assembly chaperone ATP12 [Tanticharoenia sakaeratensis NBRC 103193]